VCRRRQNRRPNMVGGPPSAFRCRLLQIVLVPRKKNYYLATSLRMKENLNDPCTSGACQNALARLGVILLLGGGESPLSPQTVVGQQGDVDGRDEYGAGNEEPWLTGVQTTEFAAVAAAYARGAGPLAPSQALSSTEHVTWPPPYAGGVAAVRVGRCASHQRTGLLDSMRRMSAAGGVGLHPRICPPRAACASSKGIHPTRSCCAAWHGRRSWHRRRPATSTTRTSPGSP
jgi:hypothetical protein